MLCINLEHISMKFEIVIIALEGDMKNDTNVDYRSTNIHNNK
jgi:hypothetical protein